MPKRRTGGKVIRIRPIATIVTTADGEPPHRADLGPGPPDPPALTKSLGSRLNATASATFNALITSHALTATRTSRMACRR